MAIAKVYGQGADDALECQPVSLGGTGSRSKKGAAKNLNFISQDQVGEPNGTEVLDEDGFVKTKNFPIEAGDITIPTIYGPRMVIADTENLFYITNYDASVTYDMSSEWGTLTRDADKIYLNTYDNYGVGSFVVNNKAFEVLVRSFVPETPSFIYPEQNSQLRITNPIIEASDYVKGVGDQEHTGTEWEVATDLAFSEVIASSIQSTPSTTWQPSDLPMGDKLYARVRYIGGPDKSKWAKPLVVNAVATDILAPVLSSVDNSSLNQTSILIKSSPFATTTGKLGTLVNLGLATETRPLSADARYVFFDVTADAANSVTVNVNGRDFVFLSNGKMEFLVEPGTSSFSYTKNDTATLKYAEVYASLTHSKSDIEIATDPEFTDVVYQLMDSVSNKTSWTIPVLEYGRTYYARARHKTSTKVSPWSNSYQFTVAKFIQTPSITFPANNATNMQSIPSFSSTLFNSLPNNLQHTGSDWQIASDPGFTTILQEQINNTTSLVTWTADVLDYSTKYYVRVRYRSSADNLVSLWSEAIAFTTSILINAPQLTAPINNASNQPIDLTLSSTSIVTTPPGQTHTASDWQIATDPAFTQIAKNVSNSFSNKTSWTVTGLDNGVQYYARVRHRSNMAIGMWSPTVTFTTIIAVNQPTLSKPLNNAIDQPIQFTLESSAITTVPANYPHTASSWEIATDINFTNIVKSTYNDTANKSSWMVTGLINGTRYYARVKHKSDVAESNWSAVSAFTTVIGINKPTITSPAANAVDLNTDITITGSAFGSVPTGQTHTTTDWQIATDIGFGNIVKSSMADAVNKTSWPVTGLSIATKYYVRVKYRSGTIESPWSDAIAFTTSILVGKPVITSPTNNAIDQQPSITITANAISTTPPGNTHTSSDWQIATDASFTSIYKQALMSTTSKTTWTPSLNYYTNYYVRVRFYSGNAVSEWSDPVAFRTAETIYTPSITSPGNGSTGLGLSVTLVASAFSSAPSGKTHDNTDWEISTNSSFSSLTASSYNDTSNKTSKSFNLPSIGTTYYARVRYRSGGMTSSWSSAISFRTYYNVVTPTITKAVASGTTITLECTTFASSPAGGTFGGARWELSTNSSFSTIAASTTVSPSSQQTVNFGGLTAGTTYYARVRHYEDSVGGTASSWSATATIPIPVDFQVNTVTMQSPYNGRVYDPGVKSDWVINFAPNPSSTIPAVGPNFVSEELQLSTNPSFPVGSSTITLNDATIVGFPSVETGAGWAGKTIYMRYRYTMKYPADSSGVTKTSAWGSSTFSVKHYVCYPSVVLDSATNVRLGFKTAAITTAWGGVMGPYYASDGSSHTETEWQLSTNSSFSTLVSSGKSSSFKTTWGVTGLTANTTYYARARQYSSSGLRSDWSGILIAKTTA